MKKISSLLLSLFILAGCTTTQAQNKTESPTITQKQPEVTAPPVKKERIQQQQKPVTHTQAS